MRKLLTGLAVLLALVGVLLLSLPTILHKAGLHPEYHGEAVSLPGKRALVITTSHAVLAAPGESEGPATGVLASATAWATACAISGSVWVLNHSATSAESSSGAGRFSSTGDGV